jgi:DNA-binding SARP family transcriptional activator/tetratricopeptide (TPR) repeat protein
VQFRVLGPVEIEVDGELLVLPRRRERCLLAVLLLDLDRVVSANRLAHLLWDGHPPEQARRTVQSHVSRIRALLAAGAAGRGVTLASVGAGYRLTVDPSAVDAHRFRSMLDAAAPIVDPAARVARRRAALDLWRGPALDNAASGWLRDRLCADLEERRLAATEDLMADSLALRREREVLPELAHLSRLHPDRERLVELHMRALHRTGRKVEALEVFARTRAYLADELGLDPGTALREVHREILQDQPSLPAPSIAPGPVPRQLPADVPGFIGRAAYLDQLDAILPTSEDAGTPVMITAIAGTAGVGKTALAVHWAHRVADRFPDGQLYVNLRGFDPSGSPMEPAAAVRGVLDALQVPPQRVPASPEAQIGLYRSLLAQRRMLVLLDNARDATLVRPLLPGAPGCLVVVTSRDQLSGLVAREGAQTLTLGLLTAAEARQLLERRLGADRVAAEPAATDEIIARCAGLPLALAIAAARAAAQPSFPLHVLAHELGETDSGLDTLSDVDDATGLRAVFSWSYEALGTDAARLFRLLGLHPGPDVAATAAASLAGLAEPRTRRLLAELTRAHLINDHHPGRYAFHDLLRAYAAELAETHETEADRHSARNRLLDHYLHTAHAAAMLINPQRHPIAMSPPLPEAEPETLHDHADALAWFTTERAVLLAAIEQAATTGFDAHVWRLAWALVDFLRRQGRWHEWADTQTVALDAGQRLADPLAQGVAHRALASAYQHLTRHDDAHAHLLRALDLFHRLGDQTSEAHTHIDIGVVLDRQGRHRQALAHALQALDLYTADGNLAAQANALNGIGWLYVKLGDHAQALTYCQHALALQREIGDPREAATWDSLGYAHHHLGQHSQAASCYQHALDLVRDQGDLFREADVLTHLGDSHSAAGEAAAARDAWQRALEIFEHIDHPQTDQLRAKLDQQSVPGQARR